MGPGRGQETGGFGSSQSGRKFQGLAVPDRLTSESRTRFSEDGGASNDDSRVIETVAVASSELDEPKGGDIGRFLKRERLSHAERQESGGSP